MNIFEPFREPKIPDLLREPETAYLDLDERRYKPEQELADRYRSFVAEILRISLAGVAVLGFLQGAFHLNQAPLCIKIVAVLGITAFALSAVFALVFLYSYAEGLRYYTLGLRHYTQTLTTNPTDDAYDRARESLAVRRERIDWCHSSKVWASLLLCLGGLCTAVAISLLLFAPN